LYVSDVGLKTTYLISFFVKNQKSSSLMAEMGE